MVNLRKNNLGNGLAMVITKVKILKLSRHSLILNRLNILVTRSASGQQFMGKLSRKLLDFNDLKSCYVLESCVSGISIRILEVWMRVKRKGRTKGYK